MALASVDNCTILRYAEMRPYLLTITNKHPLLRMNPDAAAVHVAEVTIGVESKYLTNCNAPRVTSSFSAVAVQAKHIGLASFGTICRIITHQPASPQKQLHYHL
jgi:hypothetical protein